MFKQSFVFLSISTYDFIDKSGKHIRGSTLYLVPDIPKLENDFVGAKPQKFNVSFEDFSKYRNLQFLNSYEFIFEPDFTVSPPKFNLVGVDV